MKRSTPFLIPFKQYDHEKVFLLNSMIMKRPTPLTESSWSPLFNPPWRSATPPAVHINIMILTAIVATPPAYHQHLDADWYCCDHPAYHQHIDADCYCYDHPAYHQHLDADCYCCDHPADHINIMILTAIVATPPAVHINILMLTAIVMIILQIINIMIIVITAFVSIIIVAVIALTVVT